MTLADASDVTAPTWIASAADASNAVPEETLADHAPPPLTAHQRRPSAGADSRPTTISPSTSRAIAVAHPGRPNAKLCVPSMPSRIHRLAAFPGCGPTSSPTTASAGRSRRSTSRIACSVSKSTCETGVPSALWTVVRSSLVKCDSETVSARSASEKASASSPDHAAITCSERLNRR